MIQYLLINVLLEYMQELLNNQMKVDNQNKNYIVYVKK